MPRGTGKGRRTTRGAGSHHLQRDYAGRMKHETLREDKLKIAEALKDSPREFLTYLDLYFGEASLSEEQKMALAYIQKFLRSMDGTAAFELAPVIENPARVAIAQSVVALLGSVATASAILDLYNSSRAVTYPTYVATAPTIPPVTFTTTSAETEKTRSVAAETSASPAPKSEIAPPKFSGASAGIATLKVTPAKTDRRTTPSEAYVLRDDDRPATDRRLEGDDHDSVIKFREAKAELLQKQFEEALERSKAFEASPKESRRLDGSKPRITSEELLKHAKDYRTAHPGEKVSLKSLSENFATNADGKVLLPETISGVSNMADLTNVDFSDAALSANTYFSSCNLSGSSLAGQSLNKLTFSSVYLDGTDLSDMSSAFYFSGGTSCRKANFDKTTFTDSLVGTIVNFEEATFRDASLHFQGQDSFPMANFLPSKGLNLDGATVILREGSDWEESIKAENPIVDSAQPEGLRCYLKPGAVLKRATRNCDSRYTTYRLVSSDALCAAIEDDGTVAEGHSRHAVSKSVLDEYRKVVNQKMEESNIGVRFVGEDESAGCEDVSTTICQAEFAPIISGGTLLGRATSLVSPKENSAVTIHSGIVDGSFARANPSKRSLSLSHLLDHEIGHEMGLSHGFQGGGVINCRADLTSLMDSSMNYSENYGPIPDSTSLAIADHMLFKLLYGSRPDHVDRPRIVELTPGKFQIVAKEGDQNVAMVINSTYCGPDNQFGYTCSVHKGSVIDQYFFPVHSEMSVILSKDRRVVGYAGAIGGATIEEDKPIPPADNIFTSTTAVIIYAAVAAVAAAAAIVHCRNHSSTTKTTTRREDLEEGQSRRREAGREMRGRSEREVEREKRISATAQELARARVERGVSRAAASGDVSIAISEAPAAPRRLVDTTSHSAPTSRMAGESSATGEALETEPTAKERRIEAIAQRTRKERAERSVSGAAASGAAPSTKPTRATTHPRDSGHTVV